MIISEDNDLTLCFNKLSVPLRRMTKLEQCSAELDVGVVHANTPLRSAKSEGFMVGKKVFVIFVVNGCIYKCQRGAVGV